MLSRGSSTKLAIALRAGNYERLIIAAAPRLMGYLRDHLDIAVRATIRVEVDKDFAQWPLEKLGKALAPHLYS